MCIEKNKSFTRNGKSLTLECFLIMNYYWYNKIALVYKSSNKESSLTFWFELIDESCLVISCRNSTLSKAEILIGVATSVM